MQFKINSKSAYLFQVLAAFYLGGCYADINPIESKFNIGNNFLKYRPTTELNGKFGNKRQIGRWSFLLPLFQNNETLIFANAIGMLDSKNTLEGNFGLGIRHQFSDSIVGTYAYYDRRRTQHKNIIQQATLGAEYLREFLEVRANLYLPENKQKLINSSYNLSATPLLTTTLISQINNQQFEVPLWGFDAELGSVAPSLPNLKGYVGYYRFTAKGLSPLNGIRVRSDYRINRFLSIEGEMSYDNKRKTNIFLGIKASFSFGKKQYSDFSSLDEKMTQIPIRDVDIVVDQKTKKVKREHHIAGKWKIFNANKIIDSIKDQKLLNLLNNNLDSALDSIKAGMLSYDARQEIQTALFSFLNGEIQGILVPAENGEFIRIPLHNFSKIALPNTDKEFSDISDVVKNFEPKIHDPADPLRHRKIPLLLNQPIDLKNDIIKPPPMDVKQIENAKRYLELYDKVLMLEKDTVTPQEAFNIVKTIADEQFDVVNSSRIKNFVDRVQVVYDNNPEFFNDPSGINLVNDILPKLTTVIVKVPRLRDSMLGILSQIK